MGGVDGLFEGGMGGVRGGDMVDGEMEMGRF